MSAPHLDLFRDSGLHVLETMGLTPVTSSDPYEKTSPFTFGIVTGIIGFAGEGQAHTVSSTLSLSFDKAAILEILTNMLMSPFTEINDEVLDAVGELTNIVCGDIKRRLFDRDVRIGMATPIVIEGEGIKVRDRATRKTFVIPYHTAKGHFVLETNFTL